MWVSLLALGLGLVAGSGRAQEAPAPLPEPIASTPAAKGPEGKVDPEIQPAAQPPRPPVRPIDRAPRRYRLPLDLPGAERLFRLDSDDMLFERMKQEARDEKVPERITFPDEPVLSKDPYYGRDWPQQTLFVEPAYVCHKRLFFEELNSERYGWDLGLAGPFVSTGYFFKDLFLLPYHAFTNPCRKYECSSGKCRPGDPVPYLLYPEGLSVTGAAAEIGTIAALMAIFP